MITLVLTTRYASSTLLSANSICKEPAFFELSPTRPADRVITLLICLSYIYGYLNRVRSSRRLEAETRRNLEVMWLLRGLTPDFKTIADFRKDNRDAFEPVFRQFVLLSRKLDLYGGGLLAGAGNRPQGLHSTPPDCQTLGLT